MKGLLLKDLYQLIKYCKMFFLIDVVFLASSFFLEESAMFVNFPVIFSGILPLTLLSYDERTGWSNYCGTLPYSEKQIVSAKYLFGLIIQLLTVIVVIGAVYVRGFVFDGYDFIENLSVIGIIFMISLLCPALCLPFCFKFGTEKGRIAYFIIIALLMALCMSFYDKLGGEGQIITKDSSGFLLPILGGIAVLYVVSWIVSVPLLKSVKK